MSLDVLSNMLSTIKNAALVNKPYVEIMYTKQCEEVAKVLQKKGYLAGVKVFKDSGKPFKRLHIDLAYDLTGKSAITDLKRVSKPGRRIYKKTENLGRYMGGFGMRVISTPRGVLSDDEAKKKKLGGEVICQVY